MMMKEEGGRGDSRSRHNNDLNSYYHHRSLSCVRADLAINVPLFPVLYNMYTFRPLP